MTVERSFDVFGRQRVDVLVSSGSSEGRMCVVVQHIPPGDGFPIHINARADEFLKPLEGEFEVFVNGEWIAMPTEGVYFGRGADFHGARCVGSTPGKIMAVSTPGGLEVFLEKHVDLRLPRDDAAEAALGREYGIRYRNDETASSAI